MKRYRFLEALDKIVGTERRIRYLEDDKKLWFYYDGDSRQLYKDNINSGWWPQIVDQTAEMWEIEPEPIYVWGACDSDNLCFLHSDKPELNDDGDWSADKGSELHFKENNIFPKNKPQKYKLEPVEDE